MLDLQIRLLYLKYHLSIDKIAKLLDYPSSVVRLSIQNQGLDDPEVEVLPALPADNEAAVSPYVTDISNLKSLEVTKQYELAPLIAAIEVSLLHKLLQTASNIDPTDVRGIGDIVQILKMLTKNTVGESVAKEETKTIPAMQQTVMVVKWSD